MTKVMSGIAAILLVLSFVGATVAHADLASARAAVVAAKEQGIVGEQGDGYLGFVKGSADPTTEAAVNEINAGRAEVYRETAQKTGVTPEAAGEAAANVIIGRLAKGRYYKPLDGAWTRK